MTTKQGGVVTIRIKPGQPSYSGTKRYGVNSQNYGSWDGSFVLLKQ